MTLPHLLCCGLVFHFQFWCAPSLNNSCKKPPTLVHFIPTKITNALRGLVEINKCMPIMVDMFTRCNQPCPQKLKP